MKGLLSVMIMLAILPACLGDKNPETLYAASAKPLVIVKETLVDVKLTDAEVRLAGGDFSKAMWEKATFQGMKAIMNKFMYLEPIVAPIRTTYPEPDEMSFFERRGKVVKVENPVTGDYEQSFRLTATFTPEWKVSGQVTRLENDRYALSMLDRMSVTLFDYFPRELPAFFLLAQRTPEGDGRLMRVVGSGRILQSLGTTVVVDVEGSSVQGTLAQAELTETNQEIYKGDIIFLIPVIAEALLPAEIAETGDSGLPEVVVEPKTIVEVVEPEISK